jgi:hypothetical protein
VAHENSTTYSQKIHIATKSNSYQPPHNHTRRNWKNNSLVEECSAQDEAFDDENCHIFQHKQVHTEKNDKDTSQD